MFKKRKKKEFKFSESLIEQAQAVEASAKKSSAKSSSIEAEVKDDGKRQKLAERQAQIKHLQHQLTKTEAAVRKATKKRRTTARAKTDQQVKNSSFHFAGKHTNTGKSKPVDKLKAASERFRINNYGSDHKAKARDREASQKYNLQLAHNHHEATAPSTGAWATISSCEERFGLLSTTIQRAAGEGHILTRSTGKTTLVSVPTLEKFLTDSE